MLRLKHTQEAKLDGKGLKLSFRHNRTIAIAPHPDTLNVRITCLIVQHIDDVLSFNLTMILYYLGNTLMQRHIQFLYLCQQSIR